MNALEGKFGLAPFAIHGGRLAEARARYPHARQPWIDLSTGIAPWPYPIPQLPVECWARLPEPAALERLITAARVYYQVPDAASVVAVPGTDVAIGLIARLMRERSRVAIVSPTYASHASMWRAAGHEVREIARLDEIADCDTGVVVNPNNPDGRVAQPRELRGIARGIAAKGGALIVDEAFADVCPGVSVLDGTSEAPGIVVLRSFGKFFGLAGVRLGFVIGAHPIVGALADTLGAWPVSGPALAMGVDALSDNAWIARQRTRAIDYACQLRALLAKSGHDSAGGTDLFELITHPQGGALFDHLARCGILVRPFESGRRLRFGLPSDEAQMLRLEDALAGWNAGRTAR